MQVVRDHVAKGALSMIDWANNKPANAGKKPKVGGHQASSMSSVDLLCALYLDALAAGDRLAVKPHAAPIVYALMHLFGQLPVEQMDRLREFKGPQPYPTKLKNPGFVDYTTSSEALGVATTIYDAYGAKVQNRALRAKVDAEEVTATYWAHSGDGELTEGQIDESLYDAGRWRLDNLIWIVDLNRQSLDRVMEDSGRLEDWVAAKFASHDWDVRPLRWGRRAEALFARTGGRELREVLDGLSDALFHPFFILDGGTVRRALLGETDDDRPAFGRLLQDYATRLQVTATQRAGMRRALHGVSDTDLAAAISHLGGHDLGALSEAYKDARSADRPVVLIAHTVKGYETSAAGHPENHGMLLSSEEVAAWGLERGLPADTRYPTPTRGTAASKLLEQRATELYTPADHVYAEPPVPAIRAVVDAIALKPRKKLSTGEAFQSLNLALLRTELAPYLQFGAPDVGQTTHLGPIIKSTGVFSPRDLPDTFAWLREERKLTFDWRPSNEGQFHAFGIAEGNAMLWAYAFGRQKKAVERKLPVLPVVTVYDKFFERAFNQLDYAAYSGGRFIAVGTPSGTGLSRETATHQSIQTLRMLMDLPGILAYEPAFQADVHAIYLHAMAQLWEPSGEAVYLRLTTQPLQQPADLPPDHARRAIAGAYWLEGADDRPAVGGKRTVVFVASGRKLREVRLAAAGLQADHGIGSRILNVTSYEALWRDWDAFASDPGAWDDPARTYYLHELFSNEELNAPLIMTGDHVPSVCEWLPNALQRVRGARFLGPRTNGEAGALDEVDALHGMGVNDLVQAALDECSWRDKALG